MYQIHDDIYYIQIYIWCAMIWKDFWDQHYFLEINILIFLRKRMTFPKEFLYLYTWNHYFSLGHSFFSSEQYFSSEHSFSSAHSFFLKNSFFSLKHSFSS